MENKNKGRILKYLYQRMPEEIVGITEIKKEINKRTGLKHRDINELFEIMEDIFSNSIINKKGFSIPGIGIIYPTIKPGKNVVNINKHSEKSPELMYMPERWVCKFKVKPSFAKELLEITPTKAEVDNIYKN